jgi:hypothetical protein
MWRLQKLSSGHNEDGYRKLQKSFFIWLFCDYLFSCLFLYFTSVLNRLTYIGCCRTNNYRSTFASGEVTSTSPINFGGLCLVITIFKQFNWTFLRRNDHKKNTKIFTKDLLKKSQKPSLSPFFGNYLRIKIGWKSYKKRQKILSLNCDVRSKNALCVTMGNSERFNCQKK